MTIDYRGFKIVSADERPYTWSIYKDRLNFRLKEYSQNTCMIWIDSYIDEIAAREFLRVHKNSKWLTEYNNNPMSGMGVKDG